MKYIELMNGKQLEVYDYNISNAFTIKLLDKDISDVKDFFGDSVIKTIRFLDEDKNFIEQREINMKVSSFYTENETIYTNEDILIEDAHDDSPAQYKTISVANKVTLLVAVFEKPSVYDMVEEIQTEIGIVDTTALDLNGWKDYKQEENKKALAKFLANAYIPINGKNYGVTEEDQNEMSLNYMQYTIAKSAGIDGCLEWHAKKEKCEPMTEDQFLYIAMAIKTFVYPYYNLMQQYKENIYNCNTIQEVKDIEFAYELTQE